MPTLPIPAEPTIITQVSKFLPENLRDYELYPKISEMLEYILAGAVVELQDVKYKYQRPDLASEDVIKEIIQELGYQYIKDVMDTINNFQFNTLLDFLSLIQLLKGSRTGLDLILKLLGFESVIEEWWEATPNKPPFTYEIIIIMDQNRVPNIFKTLEKIQIFAEHYVYPKISNIDFRFQLSFAERNANFGGFFRLHYAGTIRQRAFA